MIKYIKNAKAQQLEKIYICIVYGHLDQNSVLKIMVKHGLGGFRRKALQWPV